MDDGVFYCEHLYDTARSRNDIADFRVRHPQFAAGLEVYLREKALADEKSGVMRTYLVRAVKDDGLVGYFSLKAGLVSLNERDVPDSGRIVFDTVPGIEIANFAVNEKYQEKHPTRKGIGAIIFRDFIRRLALRVAEVAGAKVLYIFALPYEKLIRNYHDRYCFVRLREKDEEALHNRLKPAYDEFCIFMYQMLN